MKTKQSSALSGLVSLSLLGSFSPLVARADNPIVQNMYTADPAPMVYNDRVYIFAGHDEDNSTYYDLREWQLFSSADMANWQHHGSPDSIETFSWASEDAWASQAVERNGKFYHYVPVTEAATGSMALGVAVSDNIEGPYTDAIGEPLVSLTEIDPTVFIDPLDDQAYLYWGNPGLYYVLLNEDMVSYSGEVVQVNLTTSSFGVREGNPDRPTLYEEGPWLYEREGLYYMVFAADCCAESIHYSTGPTALGPWTYAGPIMEAAGASATNHVGIVEFKGRNYFVYHTEALEGGGSFTRSVSVEEFEYNSDDGWSFPTIVMTDEGPEQVGGPLDPFVRQEAETMAWGEGIEVEVCSEGGMNVCGVNNGDYIKVKGVGFGEDASLFTASVSSEGAGGTIELRVGSLDGTKVGECEVGVTGGWQTWTTTSCEVSGATGTTDLYLVFVGDSGVDLFNVDWWQFS